MTEWVVDIKNSWNDSKPEGFRPTPRSPLASGFPPAAVWAAIDLSAASEDPATQSKAAYQNSESKTSPTLTTFLYNKVWIKVTGLRSVNSLLEVCRLANSNTTILWTYQFSLGTAITTVASFEPFELVLTKITFNSLLVQLPSPD